jgi:hypothetical protein
MVKSNLGLFMFSIQLRVLDNILGSKLIFLMLSKSLLNTKERMKMMKTMMMMMMMITVEVHQMMKIIEPI